MGEWEVGGVGWGGVLWGHCATELLTLPARRAERATIIRMLNMALLQGGAGRGGGGACR